MGKLWGLVSHLGRSTARDFPALGGREGGGRVGYRNEGVPRTMNGGSQIPLPTLVSPSPPSDCWRFKNNGIYTGLVAGGGLLVIAK